jgi:hypothetical protein
MKPDVKLCRSRLMQKKILRKILKDEGKLAVDNIDVVPIILFSQDNEYLD